jgi:tyrosinase
MATPFTATLETGRLDADFSRIDIEFLGVDHSGSSYEGRVYLNNPAADASTARSAEAGYVGSYFIFGHGGCLGEPGHCDVRPRRTFDPRPGHHLTGARKVVIAAERVAQKALAAGDQVTVTVVALVTAVGPASGWDDDVLKFDRVRIVTYRAAPPDPPPPPAGPTA